MLRPKQVNSNRACAAAPPSLKPFLKRRGKSFRYLIRPVPVVFLLIAFTLQLSARATLQSIFRISGSRLHETPLHTFLESSLLLYMTLLKIARKHQCKGLQSLSRRLTFPNPCRRISTHRALALLDVERTTTASPAKCVRLVSPLTCGTSSSSGTDIRKRKIIQKGLIKYLHISITDECNLHKQTP